MNLHLRLSSTPTARDIFTQQRRRSPFQHPPNDATQLQNEIPQFTDVASLSRRCIGHTTRVGEKPQQKRFSNTMVRTPQELYTDAVSYPGRRAMAAVETTTHALLKRPSILTLHAVPVEGVAIALALAQTPWVILSHSEQACRTISSGLVSQTTRQVLSKCPPNQIVRGIWAPSHAAMPAYEATHKLVRELHCSPCPQAFFAPGSFIAWSEQCIPRTQMPK